MPWASNCILSSNLLVDCFQGLSISPNCANNQIINNNFTGAGEAIWLWGSDNIISGNRFSNYRVGIDVFEGNDNVITANFFVDVGSDIAVYNAQNTIMKNNTSIKTPTVTLLSGKNTTYNSSSVPLVFTVNDEYSWLGYSLNNLDNVTIDGNTTLTGLRDGNYSLVVYANSTSGNMGASETIYFTVDVPEPFPTALVATASAASAGIIAVGLLVHFKKRKH